MKLDANTETTGKEPLNGFLDHLRANLAFLDQMIIDAGAILQKRTGRGHSLQSQREWSEHVADLLQQRKDLLDSIKLHVLGRDQVGAMNEPSGPNAQIEFERKFNTLLQTPWAVDGLKLTCKRCGLRSEDVTRRTIYGPPTKDQLGFDITQTEDVDICHTCFGRHENDKREI